jgi:hypothetical protein
MDPTWINAPLHGMSDDGEGLGLSTQFTALPLYTQHAEG